MNSLQLRSPEGELLSLNEDGSGSFMDYLKRCLCAFAQKELEQGLSGKRLRGMNEPECPAGEAPFLIIEDGKVTDLNWDRYLNTITRMKTAPAFDALDLSSPENDEFGESDLPETGKKDPDRETIGARHFTEFSFRSSTVHGEMADAQLVKMMNPLSYIGQADTAPYWRVRHGMYDRDTSLAIPMILALYLENRGYQVDFELPWGLPHSGDYDLDELFDWIDGICRAKA